MCAGPLHLVLAEHRMRNQLAVVFLVRAVQASLNDPLAQRVELRNQELLQLAREKLAPLARALFVDIHATLDLLLDAKKDAGNHGAFDAQLIGNVAEQREERLAHLFAAKLGAAAAGQVLAGNPLRHEAHLPRADVLVGNQHIAGFRRVDDLASSRLA